MKSEQDGRKAPGTLGRTVLSILSSPVGEEKSRVKMASPPTASRPASPASWKKAPLCQYFCRNFQLFFGASPDTCAQLQ